MAQRYSLKGDIKKYFDRSIEELPDTISEETLYSLPIIVATREDGTMGSPEHKTLREHYPNLFEGLMKHISKRNSGKLYIHEEEGKPKVIVFLTVQNGNYSRTRALASAMRTFQAARVKGIAGGLQFVALKYPSDAISRILNRLGFTDEVYRLSEK